MTSGIFLQNKITSYEYFGWTYERNSRQACFDSPSRHCLFFPANPKRVRDCKERRDNQRSREVKQQRPLGTQWSGAVDSPWWERGEQKFPTVRSARVSCSIRAAAGRSLAEKRTRPNTTTSRVFQQQYRAGLATKHSRSVAGKRPPATVRPRHGRGCAGSGNAAFVFWRRCSVREIYYRTGKKISLPHAASLLTNFMLIPRFMIAFVVVWEMSALPLDFIAGDFPATPSIKLTLNCGREVRYNSHELRRSCTCQIGC